MNKQWMNKQAELSTSVFTFCQLLSCALKFILIQRWEQEAGLTNVTVSLFAPCLPYSARPID